MPEIDFQSTIVLDEKSLPTETLFELGKPLGAEKCSNLLDVSFTPDPLYLLLVL